MKIFGWILLTLVLIFPLVNISIGDDNGGDAYGGWADWAKGGGDGGEGGEGGEGGDGGGDEVAILPDSPTKDAKSVGINAKEHPCLFGMGKGCFDYEKAVGIDEAQHPGMSATTIVQDVIFAATYMVGTVLTIVIIWCGLGYILASKDGKDASTYRKGLVSAAIGAVLVWGAYGIVRLIQYIANG